MSKLFVDEIQPKTTGSTSITGVTNAPAFEAYLSSTQTVTDATTTKVQVNTKVFDTNNCYDNSTNYRFTPTVAGVYYTYVNLTGKAGGDNQLASVDATIFKNSSVYSKSSTQFFTNYEKTYTCSLANSIVMNGSTDYLEFFGYVNVTTGSGLFLADSISTYFGAYKLIGV